MPLSAIQPDRYDVLLAAKAKELADRFASLTDVEPIIHRSSPTGFRMRAEFRIWHEGDDLNYVMFRRGAPKQPVTVTDFPIVCDAIRHLMPVLRDHLKSSPVLRRKLFQVEFLATLAGDMLVSLLYHRPLGDDWNREAGALASRLGLSIVGRSRKQKCIIGRDWVTETLSCRDRSYRYRQPEQAFTQPNARVNEAMLEWAVAQASTLDGDLLELYCGIGNFTLPLATCFDSVIATEMSKTATAAAQYNRLENGIQNIEFARLSAEEVSQAMAGTRTFRRLGHLPKPLCDYQLQTLFVDPPRAGLDPDTLQLTTRFKNVLYVSCNPDTLIDNLVSLGRDLQITSLAFFDQFPYTHHMECAVALERR